VSAISDSVSRVVSLNSIMYAEHREHLSGLALTMGSIVLEQEGKLCPSSQQYSSSGARLRLFPHITHLVSGRRDTSQEVGCVVHNCSMMLMCEELTVSLLFMCCKVRRSFREDNFFNLRHNLLIKST